VTLLQVLPPGAGLSAPLAVTTVSATIAAGFWLARYAGSRARAAARQREHQFERALDEFLAGRRRGRDLRRDAARLDAELFWEAVGGLKAHLSRRASADLEQALERTSHVRDERWALREGDAARRELAARRLAWIGAATCRRSLRRAMAAGPEPVTLAAATALARLRDGGALRWILEHPASLEHRSPRARLALLRAFGRGAAPHLEAALERGLGEPRMERAILEGLASMNRRAAAPLIAARLDHAWRDVRVAAARALGALGASEFRGAVAARLADPDWRVRAQAARALGRLAAVEAIPSLRLAMRDANWWVRRHAAYALAALGAPGQGELREAEASDPDRFARDIAAEALRGGFPGR